ncbi:hypothetical protein [Brachybacterium hainanense]|uniref:Tetratricopeptide repeat protein n=1 Tax=Brachybacterium hainanense TaxID=1541174 RepID=A0ABV6RF74_9MICO
MTDAAQTAAAEQDRLIGELLRALATDDALDPHVLEIRAQLAEATARTGAHEDAVKQADELLKDAQREHGPEHPSALRARAAVDLVLDLAGIERS